MVLSQIFDHGGCLSVTADGKSHGFTFHATAAAAAEISYRVCDNLRNTRRGWLVHNSQESMGASSPYVGCPERASPPGIQSHFLPRTPAMDIWRSSSITSTGSISPHGISWIAMWPGDALCITQLRQQSLTLAYRTKTY